MLSPSSSHKALRPVRLSRGLFLSNKDNEEEDHRNKTKTKLVLQTPTPSTPQNFLFSSRLKRTRSFSGLLGEPSRPMQHIESGMLIPYNEGEPTAANAGIV